MSENQEVVTNTVQTESAKTTMPALDRLSKDFGGEDIKVIDTPKTETTTPTTDNTEKPQTPTPEELLKTEAKELGLPEDSTKEQIEKFKADKEAETTWKLDEVQKTAEEESDGTWKGLIETFGLGDIPADYSEEKGFEVAQDFFNKKLDAAREEGRTELKFDRFVDVPEQMRGEAELVVELMKSGQTLQQINEPFIELAQFKAMSKEELVRHNLMFRYKGDEEVVNNKMEKLIEDGQLDLEYKSAKADLDIYEQTLNGQRQQQVKNYQEKQQQIQQQRFNQETAKLNYALDRVSEYLGKKLTPEVKEALKKDLASGKYHSMEGTHEEKVDYLLYRKFGKQGIKSFQDRALEKITLENKQNQHNVPILTTGSANRVTPTNTSKSVVEQRLEQQYGT